MCSWNGSHVFVLSPVFTEYLWALHLSMPQRCHRMEGYCKQNAFCSPFITAHYCFMIAHRRPYCLGQFGIDRCLMVAIAWFMVQGSRFLIHDSRLLFRRNFYTMTHISKTLAAGRRCTPWNWEHGHTRYKMWFYMQKKRNMMLNSSWMFVREFVFWLNCEQK